ncbi:F-box/kelch-repeat protein At3g23880-like [Rutidosis leptorrhynchoides]|uniref:F-box/kelch-repeat protein At3g23880-like n=1 Tax=Rutidosis leptorrhynchoides TaxID=125765 RepID=UPI003A99CB65
MLDHVPFEILIEIMTRLPVKSLIQFTSVLKTWKSLIRSSKFIADYYTNLRSQRQHLIQYNHHSHYQQNCFVSIVDDNTFPEHQLTLTTPSSLSLDNLALVGSSHGLFCFVARKGTNILSKVVVIWNPSIRKSVAIYVHNDIKEDEDCFLGFGVCPNTLDPKIIKICKFDGNLEVVVFTLSSRTWRSPLSNIMLSNNLTITSPYSNIVIGGLIYWCALKSFLYTIVSFDLTSEEFVEIQLPDELKLSYQMDSRIFKLRESLVVVQQHMNNDYQVWIMENKVTKSFTKLFNINILPDLSVIKPCGFRMNDQLILESSCHLVAYDPSTESIKNLGFDGRINSFDVTSYTESLLLIDNSESLIY